MKISLSSLLRSTQLTALLLSSPAAIFAQGSDNPTGVTGAFNGNNNTGCSYDPYTGDATRTIPDLGHGGGLLPLVWARAMNGRGNSGKGVRVSVQHLAKN